MADEHLEPLNFTIEPPLQGVKILISPLGGRSIGET